MSNISDYEPLADSDSRFAKGEERIAKSERSRGMPTGIHTPVKPLQALYR